MAAAPAAPSYPGPETEPVLRIRHAWPSPPGEAAFRGLAGDIVRVLEDHTEADRVALLATQLIYFGGIVGRSPHFVVEETRHGVNEFAVLVGESAKGRKGTSRGRVHSLFAPCDPTWATTRIVRGLSSGEGLIWSVRDAMDAATAATVDPTMTRRRNRDADPGVADKRLLVVAEEFASTLRVLERDGNTLSPVIRSAWDGEPLQLLTKNFPASCAEPHISILGHGVKQEILRRIDETEVANGFANRFLWLAVRRSKELPEGGSPPRESIEPLQRRVEDAVQWATGIGAMTRSPAMRDLWRAEYSQLSAPRVGLLGAVLARAEAHVLRLAALYALLDKSAVIELTHLESALALWDYADRSATYIFGDALGDPLADEILGLLRRNQDGQSRTEMRNHFSRHRYGARLERSLATLYELNLARVEMVSTGGRPEERWHATEATGRGAGEQCGG